jgi:hypothetical protein
MTSERRFFSRAAVDLDAELVNGSGEHCPAHLRNLSVEGLLLRGDASLQRLVRQPQSIPGAPLVPIDVEVSFMLPAVGGPVPMKLACRHLHTRRVSQDVFELGFTVLPGQVEQTDIIGEYLRALNLAPIR